MMTMNIDFIAERTLRSTSRLVTQGMWLLFLVAAGLMMVLRHSATARAGSLWILGLAILGFMASFALRDVLRKVGHRNTENKIVNDVKTFLEKEPALPMQRITRLKAAPVMSANPAEAKPARRADFIALKGAVAYRTSAGEPVVFDAIPSRESLALKMEFHAVLMPVMTGC